MNKKLVLSLAVLLAGVALGHAGSRKVTVPEDQLGQPVFSADYAGYDYARSSVTANNVQVSSGELVFVGFIASSNTSPTDFIMFRDTDSVITTETTDEVFRVYLGTQASQSTQMGTYFKPPVPVRFKKGMAFKANVATINLITVFFQKFGN